MSAYQNHETQFTDQQCLVEVLQEEGYEVQVNAVAQPLEGYHGDKRAQTAEIILPRRSVNKFSGGASNDIGFKKQADGTFKAIVSDYDHGVHGEGWRHKIAQKYAEKKATSLAKAHGASFSKREEVTKADGKKVTRLTFIAPTQVQAGRARF